MSSSPPCPSCSFLAVFGLREGHVESYTSSSSSSMSSSSSIRGIACTREAVCLWLESGDIGVWGTLQFSSSSRPLVLESCTWIGRIPILEPSGIDDRSCCIAAGAHHLLFCNGENVWGFGSNRQGELGYREDSHSPVQQIRSTNPSDLRSDEMCTYIACGSHSSVVVTSLNRVFVTGAKNPLLSFWKSRESRSTSDRRVSESPTVVNEWIEVRGFPNMSIAHVSVSEDYVLLLDQHGMCYMVMEDDMGIWRCLAVEQLQSICVRQCLALSQSALFCEALSGRVLSIGVIGPHAVYENDDSFSEVQQQLFDIVMSNKNACVNMSASDRIGFMTTEKGSAYLFCHPSDNESMNVLREIGNHFLEGEEFSQWIVGASFQWIDLVPHLSVEVQENKRHSRTLFCLELFVHPFARVCSISTSEFMLCFSFGSISTPHSAGVNDTKKYVSDVAGEAPSVVGSSTFSNESQISDSSLFVQAPEKEISNGKQNQTEKSDSFSLPYSSSPRKSWLQLSSCEGDEVIIQKIHLFASSNPSKEDQEIRRSRDPLKSEPSTHASRDGVYSLSTSTNTISTQYERLSQIVTEAKNLVRHSLFDEFEKEPTEIFLKAERAVGASPSPDNRVSHIRNSNVTTTTGSPVSISDFEKLVRKYSKLKTYVQELTKLLTKFRSELDDEKHVRSKLESDIEQYRREISRAIHLAAHPVGKTGKKKSSPKSGSGSRISLCEEEWYPRRVLDSRLERVNIENHREKERLENVCLDLRIEKENLLKRIEDQNTEIATLRSQLSLLSAQTDAVSTPGTSHGTRSFYSEKEHSPTNFSNRLLELSQRYGRDSTDSSDLERSSPSPLVFSTNSFQGSGRVFALPVSGEKVARSIERSVVNSEMRKDPEEPTSARGEVQHWEQIGAFNQVQIAREEAGLKTVDALHESNLEEPSSPVSFEDSRRVSSISTSPTPNQSQVDLLQVPFPMSQQDTRLSWSSPLQSDLNTSDEQSDIDDSFLLEDEVSPPLKGSLKIADHVHSSELAPLAIPPLPLYSALPGSNSRPLNLSNSFSGPVPVSGGTGHRREHSKDIIIPSPRSPRSAPNSAREQRAISIHSLPDSTFDRGYDEFIASIQASPRGQVVLRSMTDSLSNASERSSAFRSVAPPPTGDSPSHHRSSTSEENDAEEEVREAQQPFPSLAERILRASLPR